QVWFPKQAPLRFVALERLEHCLSAHLFVDVERNGVYLERGVLRFPGPLQLGVEVRVVAVLLGWFRRRLVKLDKPRRRIVVPCCLWEPIIRDAVAIRVSGAEVLFPPLRRLPLRWFGRFQRERSGCLSKRRRYARKQRALFLAGAVEPKPLADFLELRAFCIASDVARGEPCCSAGDGLGKRRCGPSVVDVDAKPLRNGSQAILRENTQRVSETVRV